MARLSTAHLKFNYGPDGMPTGCVETIHFTRTDMPPVYADAVKASPYCVDVYESEQVVIVRYECND